MPKTIWARNALINECLLSVVSALSFYCEGLDQVSFPLVKNASPCRAVFGTVCYIRFYGNGYRGFDPALLPYTRYHVTGLMSRWTLF